MTRNRIGVFAISFLFAAILSSGYVANKAILREIDMLAKNQDTFVAGHNIALDRIKHLEQRLDALEQSRMQIDTVMISPDGTVTIQGSKWVAVDAGGVE